MTTTSLPLQSTLPTMPVSNLQDQRCVTVVGGAQAQSPLAVRNPAPNASPAMAPTASTVRVAVSC